MLFTVPCESPWLKMSHAKARIRKGIRCRTVMAKKKAKTAKNSLTQPGKSVAAPKRLVSDLRSLIEQTRQQVSVTVNAALVLMYWNIGKRIREDVLANERAEYGKEIVQTLSAQLVEEFGAGFGRANLFAMVQFAEVYPYLEIVQTLS